MKINSLTAEKFARPEYTYGGPVSAKQINGEDWLIRGPNQSGKTLTFNAFRYALLGETIQLQTGHGNSVHLELTGGLDIHRKEAGLSVTDQGVKEEDPKAAEKLIDKALGNRDLAGLSFIHSHISRLPLEILNRTRRVETILNSTSKGLADVLRAKEEEIEEIRGRIEEEESTSRALEKRLSSRTGQVSELERQQEDWKSIVESAETGTLEEVSQTLQEHPDIDSDIQDALSRKRSLQIQIRELKNEKTRADELEMEVEELILDAMDEFLCPVCDGRVGRKHAKSRISGGMCPFCDRPRNLDELREHLDSEKEEADSNPDEIEAEIQEAQEEFDTTLERIEELKEEKSILAEINDKVISELDKHEHDLEEVESVARSNLAEVEEDLSEYRKMKAELEERKTKVTERIDDLEEEVDEKQAELQQLQEESLKSSLRDFEQVWMGHYQEIAPSLARDLKIRQDGGAMLVDEDGRNRRYNRRGDLSDAELVLLNISFSCAVLDMASNIDELSWDTLVLDEPFARLDSEVKKSAMEYLRASRFQLILTSSDETIWNQFPETQTTTLTRQTQATLNSFQP